MGGNYFVPGDLCELAVVASTRHFRVDGGYQLGTHHSYWKRIICFSVRDYYPERLGNCHLEPSELEGAKVPEGGLSPNLQTPLFKELKLPFYLGE